MTNPTYLTTGQAAARLGVTGETIRRWAEAGKVRHVRMPSGRLRFDPADIDALLVPTEAVPAC